MRVWGVASVSSDIRRKMGSIPSASLVRAPPPPSFKVTVPETQEGFLRLRVDAPMPDPSKGAMAALPGRTKAYYEVSLDCTMGSIHLIAVERAVARLLARVVALFAGNDNCGTVFLCYALLLLRRVLWVVRFLIGLKLPLSSLVFRVAPQ